MGASAGVAPVVNLAVPNDPLQQYMMSNLQGGANHDYSDLLPPGIREGPMQRDIGRMMVDQNRHEAGGSMQQQPVSP